MSSFEQTLAPKERVICRTGLHWILYSAAIGPADVAMGRAIASSLIPREPVRAALLAMATVAPRRASSRPS